MNRRQRHSQDKGFSLTEVLLAAGILVIGFLLICGTLPVGVHLTARGTERSIAAVVADEAFAKVRLFGIQPVERWPSMVQAYAGVPADPNIMHVDYWDVAPLFNGMMLNPDEFAYPSTDVRPETKKYCWSAILRHNAAEFGADAFQVTVFVSHSSGAGVPYPLFDRSGRLPIQSPFPRPVPIPVEAWNAVAGATDIIRILTGPNDPAGLLRTVTDDSILVDDRTGQIMRVIERRKVTGNVNDPPVIILDGKVFEVDVDGDGNPDQMRYVWVVPPAVGGGRNPCVAVYQRLIKFQ